MKPPEFFICLVNKASAVNGDCLPFLWEISISFFCSLHFYSHFQLECLQLIFVFAKTNSLQLA